MAGDRHRFVRRDASVDEVRHRRVPGVVEHVAAGLPTDGEAGLLCCRCPRLLEVPDTAVALRRGATGPTPRPVEHVPAVEPALPVAGEDDFERTAVEREHEVPLRLHLGGAPRKLPRLAGHVPGFERASWDGQKTDTLTDTPTRTNGDPRAWRGPFARQAHDRRPDSRCEDCAKGCP